MGGGGYQQWWGLGLAPLHPPACQPARALCAQVCSELHLRVRAAEAGRQGHGGHAVAAVQEVSNVALLMEAGGDDEGGLD